MSVASFGTKISRFGIISLAGALGALGGCGEDDPTTAAEQGVQVDTHTAYAFESRFTPGVSSVSHTGQTFRHVLIEELKRYIGGLTEAIDSGRFTPTQPGDVTGSLEAYLSFDSEAMGEEPLGMSLDKPVQQKTFNSLSSGKDLKGKLAGNDTVTDHKDWNTQFVGWEGQPSAEGLLRHWFQQLETLAIERAAGTYAVDADTPVYVTADGLDLQQLIQKHLLMAVAFSQGTDDYLSDDVEGKGLNASNLQEEGKPYSALEHGWDEAFGYFGAALDYPDYTDAELAGKAEGGRAHYHDSNGDGVIDLTSEYNFGASVNAGKRDLGAVEPTDFTGQAFAAFKTGRAIISAADGELSAAQLDALRTQRDRAVEAWEGAIAATAVHYINELLQDLSTGAPLTQVAKHWSELKGFSLGLQFNPASPLGDEDFAAFHQAIGVAPALPGSDAVDRYRSQLRTARGLLQDAYGFAPANMGDDDGQGGW